MVCRDYRTTQPTTYITHYTTEQMYADILSYGPTTGRWRRSRRSVNVVSDHVRPPNRNHVVHDHSAATETCKTTPGADLVGEKR